MKTKIAKLATAAAIIIAVLIGINHLGGSIDGATVAWAAEQTIEAFKNVKTVYYVEKGPGYCTKNWARRGSDGKFEMGDFRMQSKDMITVANDRQNLTYIYNEIEKTLIIHKGVTVTTGGWLDINFYFLIRDKMEDVNISHAKDEPTGKDCVSVAFNVPEKYKGEGRSGVILFDLKTKLPVSITLWDKRNWEGESFEEINEIIYNLDITEETFEFEIPEEATIIEDQRN